MDHVLHKLARQLPVSHYLLKRYAEEVSDNPDQTMGELVAALYQEIYGRELEDAELVEICERLIKNGDEVASTPAPPPGAVTKKPSAGKRMFSDYFNEWAAGLDLGQQCLWIADFDPSRARHLYMYEDFEMVEALAALRLDFERERNRVQFEASLFGFGGGYGKQSKRDEGEVKVHDLTNMSSQDALARIAALGQRR